MAGQFLAARGGDVLKKSAAARGRPALAERVRSDPSSRWGSASKNRCGSILAEVLERPAVYAVPIRISRLPAWLAGPTTPSFSIRSTSEAALL